MSIRLRIRAGFTLIELMIGLAVLGILVVLAMPSYQHWVANSRVRATSESIQQGLRLARNQAVDLAQWVRFELVAANRADWTVCVPNNASDGCTGYSDACDAERRSGCVIQRYVSQAGDYNVRLASAVGNGGSTAAPLQGLLAAGVTFDAFGRPVDYPRSALGRVDVSSTLRGTRRLVDIVSAAGAIRECDANLPLTADTPQGCS